MSRRTRRELLAGTLGSALAAGALLPWLGASLRPALGEDRSGRTTTSEPPESRRRRQEAVRKGCDFLAKQIRGDGGFGNDKAVVAHTGLCVLALMAGGSSDGRGPYGEQVRRGVEFLVNLIEKPVAPSERYRPEGYFSFTSDSDSKMHGQGYASLALAVALGTSDAKQAAQVRSALVKAVRCMERAQTQTGGYGYEPTAATFHEGSVTVCVAQALRAARDGGILVDQKVVDNGLRYLKRSQIRSDKEDDGGFRYSESTNRHTYALTAAAISSFFLFGMYKDDPERTLERGAAYMLRQLRENKANDWYFYGNFYGAWAFWQKDGGDWRPGSTWSQWQSQVYPELLSRQQRSDGAWDDSGTMGGTRYQYGPALATAFAVLTLAIPDEPLPIFQR
jgi:hypothetical protein